MMLLSPNAMMSRGLEFGGWTKDQQSRVKRDENIRRFKGKFGPHPFVVSKIWIALQMEPIPKRLVNATETELIKFLITLNFLFKYQTEVDLAGDTPYCDRTLRKIIWDDYLPRIHSLLSIKIILPAEWNDSSINTPIFIISVDGTHCPIFEPTKNHEYSKNPKYYSHKFHKSAHCYEVALSIFTNQTVWINGPFRAGENDPEIFKKALKAKMPAGKRVIADNAYRQKELPMVSVTNAADSPAVRMFKRRVRARQETVFARMKIFDILKKDFQHGESKHKIVFESIANIVQYQLEFAPLFDA